MTQWQTQQVRAFLVVSAPMEDQLAPVKEKGLCRELVIVSWDKEDIMTSGSLECHQWISEKNLTINNLNLKKGKIPKTMPT